MKSIKTFVLAATLTLGAGVAMAQQSQVPAESQAAYQWQMQQPAPAMNGQVQAGSSDVRTGYPAGNYVPFNGDYSTLANPN